MHVCDVYTFSVWIEIVLTFRMWNNSYQSYHRGQEMMCRIETGIDQPLLGLLKWYGLSRGYAGKQPTRRGGAGNRETTHRTKQAMQRRKSNIDAENLNNEQNWCSVSPRVTNRSVFWKHYCCQVEMCNNWVNVGIVVLHDQWSSCTVRTLLFRLSWAVMCQTKQRHTELWHT